MAIMGEGLALAGILLVLFGLVQTARLFREEYQGPLPSMVNGFSPIITGSQTGSAPPLTNRPVASARPAQALLSPQERQRLSAGSTGSSVRSESGTAAAAGSQPGALPAIQSRERPSPVSPAEDSSAAVLPSTTGSPPGGDQPGAANPTDPGSAGVETQPTDANPAGASSSAPTQPVPTATEPAPAPPDWIDIPVIELAAPVVSVQPVQVHISGEDMQQWSAPDSYAAGWHASSALLGQPGNTVLNGHHNIFGSVFARLRDLVPGDQIYVWAQGRAFYYEVDQVLLLEERYAGLPARTENARWILPSEDERLTLVTCWPPESNTHRLIVVARAVP